MPLLFTSGVSAGLSMDPGLLRSRPALYKPSYVPSPACTRICSDLRSVVSHGVESTFRCHADPSSAGHNPNFTNSPLCVFRDPRRLLKSYDLGYVLLSQAPCQQLRGRDPANRRTMTFHFLKLHGLLSRQTSERVISAGVSAGW